MLFPYLISGTKCKDKVEQGAKRLLLEVGLEDEVDGMKTYELGLVDAYCAFPRFPFHVG